jgi:hypothetical protein
MISYELYLTFMFHVTKDMMLLYTVLFGTLSAIFLLMFSFMYQILVIQSLKATQRSADSLQPSHKFL